MFAFRADLKSWLAQKPVTATSDSVWYRLRCFAARRTALFTTSVLLAVTVVVAVAGLSYQNQAIKNEANKAQAVKDFMLNAFSVTDPNYSQGVDLSSKDLLRSAADKIALSGDIDEAIKFELLIALALANGRLGYYPEAIGLLNDALKLKPNNEQATALLANYLFTAGEIDSVNALLEKTQENQFKSIPQKAAFKRVRANVLAQAGQHEAALNEFSILEPLSKTPSEIIANQSLLAEIFYLNGDSTQSIKILQQLKKDHPLPATDVQNLGLNSDLVQYHDRVGNFSAAMALTEENIKAFKAILGEEHPDLGLAYNSLSVFQRLDGQLDEAIESAKTSESIYRKRYGESSEGLAQAYSNLGVAFYFKQEPDSAIEKLSLAADMLIDIFGGEHPEAMNAKANLATILNAAGHTEQALPILQDIYAIEETSLGKANRSTLYTQQSLSLALAKSGLFDAAIHHATENFSLIKAHFDNETVFLNHSRSIKGRVFFMAGDHDNALNSNLEHIEYWTEGNESVYARSLSLIAQSYQSIGQPIKANQYYNLWLQHLDKIHTKTNEIYLAGMLDWALAKQAMTQPEEAQELIVQIKAILDENQLDLPEIQTRLQKINRQ